ACCWEVSRYMFVDMKTTTLYSSHVKSTDAWLLLIASLPTAQTAARMRLWRALKTGGAAALRDGVYLLPQAEGAVEALATQADELRAAGGEAWLLSAAPLDGSERSAW